MATSVPPVEESAAFGHRSQGESRWPSTIAVLVAFFLYIALPARLILGPRWLVPALELALLVPLIVVNPSRINHLSKDLRWLSLTLIAVVNVANVSNLVLLCHFLLHGGQTNGRQLIYSAVAIWATNVCVFALWYWELDRGGPFARCTQKRAYPDFLFPQMEAPKAAPDTWVPLFIDYFYISLTNALAFSPTDTMPLTRSAKCLMSAQSVASVATIVLVGARAVNILG